MDEKALSLFFHKRSGTAVLAVIALVCAYLSFRNGAPMPLDGDKGLLLQSPNLWFVSGAGSFTLSIVSYGLISFLMLSINRSFNVLRSMTMLFCGMFLIMGLGTPDLMVQFYGGTLMCVVMLLCSVMLFSVYGAPDQTRRIFLLFLIVSLTGMCQYAIFFYIPALLLGCAQMRVLGLRAFLAAIFGIVTPPWVLIGLGIVQVDSITAPDFSNYFSSMGMSEMLPAVVAVGFTVLLGIGFTIANLFKILGYNAHTRAQNGFFSLMLLFTVLLIFIDYTEAAVYVPMLYCGTAFQIGHYFTLRRTRRSYIPILLIVVSYIAIYAWDLWT